MPCARRHRGARRARRESGERDASVAGQFRRRAHRLARSPRRRPSGTTAASSGGLHRRADRRRRAAHEPGFLAHRPRAVLRLDHRLCDSRRDAETHVGGTLRTAASHSIHIEPCVRSVIYSVSDDEAVLARVWKRLTESALSPAFTTAGTRLGRHVDEPVIDVRLRLGAATWTSFSVVSTIGTPADITAQELHVEAFFPADDATASGWSVPVSSLHDRGTVPGAPRRPRCERPHRTGRDAQPRPLPRACDGGGRIRPRAYLRYSKGFVPLLKACGGTVLWAARDGRGDR